ncbi:MAG: hypothetical protein JNL38_23390 [Myxococcales bacterium]|nr:hypothetical protein [Myxococcales bacterium]
MSVVSPTARAAFAPGVARLSRGARVGERYVLCRPRAVRPRSVVWDGRHRALDRECEVELFDAAVAPPDGDIRRTAALEHEAFVRIHDLVVESGVFVAIVRPAPFGETLAARLAQGRKMAVAECAEVLVVVAEALCHALARGVAFGALSAADVVLSVHRGPALQVGIGRASVDPSRDGLVLARALANLFLDAARSRPPSVVRIAAGPTSGAATLLGLRHVLATLATRPASES